MARSPRRSRRIVLRCLFAAAGLMCWAGIHAAHAQVGSARYSSIVIDASSGDVLEEANPDAQRHPASLTKMMTLYMTFEALRDRRISLNQTVPVSSHAASMEPSKLGLVPGTHLTVEQAILGLVTKSANDAASALGELLGGSEDRFAQMMTLRARALGMSHTTFMNASGLPNDDQWTTARDLATLAKRIIADFPGYYHYFSTPSFAWHRQMIANHDHMLRTYPGADGLKTGYTDASGHNLVTSAVRGGVRLIGVVLGAGSNPERDVHMASLLDQGFVQMDVPVSRHIATTTPHIMLVSTAHAAEAPRAAPARAAWAVQVGVFPTQEAARTAASSVRREEESGEIHVAATKLRGRTVWRAQVTGLSSDDAVDACSTRRKTGCLVIRPDSRRIAHR